MQAEHQVQRQHRGDHLGGHVGEQARQAQCQHRPVDPPTLRWGGRAARGVDLRGVLDLAHRHPFARIYRTCRPARLGGRAVDSVVKFDDAALLNSDDVGRAPCDDAWHRRTAADRSPRGSVDSPRLASREDPGVATMYPERKFTRARLGVRLHRPSAATRAGRHVPHPTTGEHARAAGGLRLLRRHASDRGGRRRCPGRRPAPPREGRVMSVMTGDAADLRPLHRHDPGAGLPRRGQLVDRDRYHIRQRTGTGHDRARQLRGPHRRQLLRDRRHRRRARQRDFLLPRQHREHGRPYPR